MNSSSWLPMVMSVWSLFEQTQLSTKSCFCNFQVYWNNMCSFINLCVICVLHVAFLTCAPVCVMLHLNTFCAGMQHFHHTLLIGVYRFKESVQLVGRCLVASAVARSTILYFTVLYCSLLQCAALCCTAVCCPAYYTLYSALFALHSALYYTLRPVTLLGQWHS